MGTTHHPWFYRLLLPLLLALLLGSLVQAQETPILTIFCQVEPNTVASTGTAQFTLRLRNIQPGLDLSQLSVNVDVTNPALIISSAINTAPPDPLLSLDFSQTVLSPTQMQIRASRVGIDTISGVEGGLAAIDLQTAQESGLVGFTLSAASLKRPDGSEIPVRADTPPTCFLAIGDAELPTETLTPAATLTPTPTSTVNSPIATPTATVTATLPPTATETPSLTPTVTETPTFTPTVSGAPGQSPIETPTPTPSATPTTQAVVATPTPRNDDLQTPLATPTPLTVTPGFGQTPDIALTLTAEAQTILLDSGDLDSTTETPIPAQPSGSILPPTATPPPLEILSPPRVEEFIAPAAEEIAIADTAPEEIIQSANAEIAESDPSINLAVETIQQPPAGILFERSPLLLRLGWTSFIAAVVLVFTSLWMRRHR